MCGIVGFIGHDPAGTRGALEASVRAMTETLTHRGPDDDGVWIDGEAGVAFGHRRLSILDLSTNGRQPFSGKYRTNRNVRKMPTDWDGGNE